MRKATVILSFSWNMDTQCYCIHDLTIVNRKGGLIPLAHDYYFDNVFRVIMWAVEYAKQNGYRVGYQEGFGSRFYDMVFVDLGDNGKQKQYGIPNEYVQHYYFGK